MAAEVLHRRCPDRRSLPDRRVRGVLDRVVDVAGLAQRVVELRAGCGTARRSRRGGRGASRCCTGRARTGRPGAGGRSAWSARRSFERCMPPCSAIERSRLITRQTVRYGSSHSTGYSHQCAASDRRGEQHRLHEQDLPERAPRAACPASAPRRTAGPAAASSPVWPVASRTSLRRKLAGVIG